MRKFASKPLFLTFAPARCLSSFAFDVARRVRQRFRFFYGTDQAVLEALESTVAPENLPPPMGQKPLDFQGWLAERIKAEA